MCRPATTSCSPRSPRPRGRCATASSTSRTSSISTSLDFNVPTTEKAALDKLIEEIARPRTHHVQAPVSELSTDRKFGYTLLLRDFASIPPRQALVQMWPRSTAGQLRQASGCESPRQGQIADPGSMSRTSSTSAPSSTSPFRPRRRPPWKAAADRHGTVAQQRPAP